MSTKVKFMLYYSLGTFIIISVIALVISGLIGIVDAVFPLDDMNNGAELFMVLFSVFMPVFIGGGLLGIYFVKPILTILSLIRCLSIGQNELSEHYAKLYNRRNKLKFSYRLYKEVLWDLSDLSRYLSDTEHKRKELEEHKKNWITGISHDLKTPLSYITGYSELLLSKDYQFEQEERLLFLSSIYNKGVTIGELIEDMSLSFKLDDYNGPLPLSCSQFDIVDFMQRLIADIINDPRTAGYELTFRCDDHRIDVNADKRLLQRAFQNIIMNGVIHNPQGTLIEIDIKAITSNQLMIDVRDNGQGMDEDMTKKLFTRYYRNPIKDDTNFSGGLGLSVAKSILEVHGGEITVTSRLSHGTTFSIVMPSNVGL